ncbi:MAG: OsmC family protein [Planctomycetota bacterium]
MTGSSDQILPQPDALCDGGDLDCGSGLLLIIRNAMTPLKGGGILELRSREISVKEDLPAWCRMVGHTIVAIVPGEQKYSHYFIKKQGSDPEVQHDLEKAKDYLWKIRIRWKEGMQAQAFCRNHSFVIGQPASFDTQDTAPSAVEYLLASLGGCLTVGFQWRLSRHKIQVFHLEMTLSAQSDNILVFLGLEDQGNPGFSQITGTLYLDSNGEPEQIQQLWKETMQRSPVTQTLQHQVQLKLQCRDSL